MRISDWSSDVCSSDLARDRFLLGDQPFGRHIDRDLERGLGGALAGARLEHPEMPALHRELDILHVAIMVFEQAEDLGQLGIGRSEEHTSELQSLMRISYAVFCLKKKKQNKIAKQYYQETTENK